MCPYCIGFFSIVEILYNEVMLRDAFAILLGQKYLFFIVKLHLKTNELELPSLKSFPYQSSISQLAGINFKLENHHTIFPTLQHEYIWRPSILKMNENVICINSAVCECGCEIGSFFVSDGVVRLLNAIVMKNLDVAYPNVKKLTHQVILLSHYITP